MYKISFKVSIDEMIEGFEGIQDLVDSISTLEIDSETAEVKGYRETEIDPNVVQERLKSIGSARELSVEEMPSIDWLAENRKEFKPIQVEDFFIYGSHEPVEVPAGVHAIKLDAATAFGTGRHPTTAGCLQAIQSLKEIYSVDQELDLVDLGCGSGILAIAACKIFPHALVLAIDNDPEAVDQTRYNSRENKVDEQVLALVSEGWSDITSAQWDVIFANILAKPLIDLAQETGTRVKNGGYVILSGLLIEQQSAVQEAYEKSGFALENEYPIEEWTSLLMKKIRRP